MSNTVSFKFYLFPAEWAGKQISTYILGVSGLLSTRYTFNFDYEITDVDGNKITSYSSDEMGNKQESFGGIPNLQKSGLKFPVTVSGNITCNETKDLMLSTSNQISLGINNLGVPACYQVSVFLEDYTDNDYNDIALNFQLTGVMK